MKGESARPPLATYREVKEEILRRIHERVWPRGGLIPSEVELAAEFGCSRGTVGRALRELAEAGIVERKRRAGTRVAEDPRQRHRIDIPIVRVQVESRGEEYRYSLLSREITEAPEAIRARIDLEAGGELLHLRGLHFANRRPFQFEDRWINTGVLPDALEQAFDTTGPNEWLVREAEYSRGEVHVTAEAANAAEAELLGTSEGTPLIALERITWLHDSPLTYVRLVHAPGYHLKLRL